MKMFLTLLGVALLSVSCLAGHGQDQSGPKLKSGNHGTKVDDLVNLGKSFLGGSSGAGSLDVNQLKNQGMKLLGGLGSHGSGKEGSGHGGLSGLASKLPGDLLSKLPGSGNSKGSGLLGGLGSGNPADKLKKLNGGH